MDNKLKEKWILAKVKAKDPDAYAELYDLYVDKIYRFIFFKISSVEEAEDLTAETFLKVWGYLNSEKKVENVKALLYRVARNLVVDLYRQRAQAEKVELNGEEGEWLAEEETTEELVGITLEIEKLQEHLAKLKEDYREVIILRFVEELSFQEIAKIMDKSKGAVRVLIHRALKTLKKIISDEK
jgi:RNA polymerase sigma-70 factor (ECF subfamily)